MSPLRSRAASLAGMLVLLSAVTNLFSQINNGDTFASPATNATPQGSGQFLAVTGPTSKNVTLIGGPSASAYVKFSSPTLPAGTSIANIQAVIYVSAVLTAGSVDVYTVLDPWDESRLTYKNLPRTGVLVVSGVPVNKPGFVSLDVTSAYLVNLAGNGFVIVANPGTPAVAFTADSKENIVTSHVANLNVELRSGPVPRGPWSVVVLYNVNDLVTYNGSAYVATTSNTGQTPGSSASWQLYVSQGSPGPQGIQGPQGPVGPIAPNGATTTQTNTFLVDQDFSGNALVKGAVEGGSFIDILGSGSGLFFDSTNKAVNIVGGPGWDINLLPGKLNSTMVNGNLDVQGNTTLTNSNGTPTLTINGAFDKITAVEGSVASTEFLPNSGNPTDIARSTTMSPGGFELNASAISEKVQIDTTNPPTAGAPGWIGSNGLARTGVANPDGWVESVDSTTGTADLAVGGQIIVTVPKGSINLGSNANWDPTAVTITSANTGIFIGKAVRVDNGSVSDNVVIELQLPVTSQSNTGTAPTIIGVAGINATTSASTTTISLDANYLSTLFEGSTSSPLFANVLNAGSVGATGVQAGAVTTSTLNGAAAGSGGVNITGGPNGAVQLTTPSGGAAFTVGNNGSINATANAVNFTHVGSCGSQAPCLNPTPSIHAIGDTINFATNADETYAVGFEGTLNTSLVPELKWTLIDPLGNQSSAAEASPSTFTVHGAYAVTVPFNPASPPTVGDAGVVANGAVRPPQSGDIAPSGIVQSVDPTASTVELAFGGIARVVSPSTGLLSPGATVYYDPAAGGTLTSNLSTNQQFSTGTNGIPIGTVIGSTSGTSGSTIQVLMQSPTVAQLNPTDCALGQSVSWSVNGWGCSSSGAPVSIAAGSGVVVSQTASPTGVAYTIGNTGVVSVPGSQTIASTGGPDPVLTVVSAPVGGDLSGGSSTMAKVAGLNGIPLDPTPPTDGQVYRFNATTGKFEPVGFAGVYVADLPAPATASATAPATGTLTVSSIGKCVATVNVVANVATSPPGGAFSVFVVLPGATTAAPGDTLQQTGSTGPTVASLVSTYTTSGGTDTVTFGVSTTGSTALQLFSARAVAQGSCLKWNF